MAQKIEKHKQVFVSAIPPCDLCRQNGKEVSAYADASLRGAGQTAWANVCKEHFRVCNCTLGLGNGQELILRRSL